MNLLHEIVLNWMYFVPVPFAVAAISARHPIHAILWLIATFIVASGLILHKFSLGFTCTLVVIVYIGAIAVRFLFIVMMIPVKKNSGVLTSKSHKVIQVILLITSVVLSYIIFESSFENVVNNQIGDLRLSVINQLDIKSMLQILPGNEFNGVTLRDLKTGDIKIYGSKLYIDSAFTIILAGLVLFYTLLAAIVLCIDE
jgi:NADH:ubiquinone oxidoreductase subunit 6 (subunit J)